jgi:Spy/CpxP family protein refolding chaperone
MPDLVKNSRAHRGAAVAAFSAALTVGALAGCTGQQKTAEGEAPYGAPANSAASPAPAASPADTGAVAGGPGGMMPMGGGDPMAPLTPTPELDQKIADAEKGADKKAVAAAYAARGTFRMNDDNAGQRVKYREALADYRKALAADPANAEAKQNKEMIESIYRSMGRPIPGEEDAKGAGAGGAKPAPPGPAKK